AMLDETAPGEAAHRLGTGKRAAMEIADGGGRPVPMVESSRRRAGRGGPSEDRLVEGHVRGGGAEDRVAPRMEEREFQADPFIFPHTHTPPHPPAQILRGGSMRYEEEYEYGQLPPS